MTAGLVLAIASVLAVFVYIVLPLIRGETRQAATETNLLDRGRELESQHAMALAALKDLEDDRQTDKIDLDDYTRIKEQLSQRAVAIMQQRDALQEERDNPPPPLRAVPEATESPSDAG